MLVTLAIVTVSVSMVFSVPNCSLHPSCEWISKMGPKAVDGPSFNSYGQQIAYSKCLLQHLNTIFAGKNSINIADTHLNDKNVQDDFNFLSEPASTVGDNKGKKIKVTMHDTYIFEITEDYERQEMSLLAHIHISWVDTRLIWTNYTCFDRPILWYFEDDLKPLIDDKSFIWVPHFNNGYMKTETNWKHLTINGTNGNISGGVEITSKMRCTYNPIRYPFDTVDCHYYISPHFFFVQFEPESPEKLKADYNDFIKDISTPPEWSVAIITETKMHNIYNNSAKGDIMPQINLQIQLKRSSQLPYTIAHMMLATSVTAGIFGPLTGSINGVKFTKLLSIATSVAGVMILAPHNPKIYHSTVTPHIFVAFQFTLAVSLMSLLLCLTHYHLMSNVIGDTPIPHMVKLISDWISLRLRWVSKLSATSAKEVVVENGEKIGNCVIQSKKSYTNEWLEISNSLHRLLFVIFFFIYLIGTIVLCNF